MPASSAAGPSTEAAGSDAGASQAQAQGSPDRSEGTASGEGATSPRSKGKDRVIAPSVMQTPAPPTVYLTSIATDETTATVSAPTPPEVPGLPAGSLAAARTAARLTAAPLVTAPCRMRTQRSSPLWSSLEDREFLRSEARRRVETERAKAIDAFRREDWGRCERSLTDAISFDKRNSSLYVYRSYVRLKQERTNGSLTDAGTAISLDPRSPRGYYRYGRSLCIEQRLPEAGASFIQGLGLDPTHGPAQLRCDDVLQGIRRQRHFWPGHWRKGRGETRVLASTPPPTATIAVAPAAPELAGCDIRSLRLTWKETEDDGGDAPFLYRLEICRIDPLDETRREYSTAWEGVDRTSLEVEGLEGDTEYAFRLACQNALGWSEWSPVLRCATKPPPEVAEQKRVDIPLEWRQLHLNLNDVLLDQMRRRRISKEKNWQYLMRAFTKCAAPRRGHPPPSARAAHSDRNGHARVRPMRGVFTAPIPPHPIAFHPITPPSPPPPRLRRRGCRCATQRRYAAPLKLSFRLYTLIGSQDDDPDDMSMAQYLQFVKDARIAADHWLPSDDDMIFILANREPAVDDNIDLSDREAVSRAKKRKQRNDANPDGELLQHEFVSACVRLAVHRYMIKPAKTDPTLESGLIAEAFGLLVERHIIPFATFEVQDELSLLVKSRGVRAAIARYRDELLEIFMQYSRADRALIQGQTKATANATMNLAELMILLKEANVIDDALTAREVCTFFVKVNMDDELYTSQERKARKIDKAETSAVLDFEEFVEIIVRVCNEKVRCTHACTHGRTDAHACAHAWAHAHPPHASARFDTNAATAQAAHGVPRARICAHAHTFRAVALCASSPQREAEMYKREQHRLREQQKELAAGITTAAPDSASQVPEPREASFEQSLATWLGLMFVPAALKNARKRAIKEGAGGQK